MFYNTLTFATHGKIAALGTVLLYIHVIIYDVFPGTANVMTANPRKCHMFVNFINKVSCIFC